MRMIRIGASITVLLTVAASGALAQSRPEQSMTASATGTFEVKLTPAPSEPAEVGRLTLDKQFHGDLDGTSQGTMLAHRTPVDGSAGYVAMERVTGTLAGRKGSFVLMHLGVMDRGAQSLSISVVPDSGTDELVGLAGTMEIIIEGGKHSYRFAYELPAR